MPIKDIKKAREWQRTYRQEKKKENPELDKIYYYKNRKVVVKVQRKSVLKRFYGITPEQYEFMEQQQGGVCAICGNKNKNGNILCVDHDHENGKVRGLLCHNCNIAIGRFQDNKDFMRNAISYLERNE